MSGLDLLLATRTAYLVTLCPSPSCRRSSRL